MHLSPPVAATVTCTNSTTSSAIVGAVIIIAIVGAIVFFAVANARARRQLAVANAELGYLRPENMRLRQWLDGSFGTTEASERPEAYPSGPLSPPEWYPDPSGRHELRYWSGEAWTEHVSDQGATSTDPTNERA